MSTSASAVQRAPSALPTANPLQGGSRRYVRTVPLCRNASGSGSYTATTTQFRVWHPSVRLHAAMTIGFRPDAGEDATIPAGFTITMDAWGKTDVEAGGFPIRGNQIIPGPFALPNTLPLTYEAVTGVDEWRGIFTAPAGGTTLATTGWFYLTVSWEPAAGATDISDVELKSIFNSCKVSGGGLAVFQTAAG